MAKSCTLAPIAQGALNEKDTWIGGELVIVQTGDILDRGDDESKIYELFEKLTTEAKAAGARSSCSTATTS